MLSIGSSIDNTHLGDTRVFGDLEVTEDLILDGGITLTGDIDVKAPACLKTDCIKPSTASGNIAFKSSSETPIITLYDNTTVGVHSTLFSSTGTLNMSSLSGTAQLQLNDGKGVTTAGVRMPATKLNVNEIQSQDYDTGDNPKILFTASQVEIKGDNPIDFKTSSILTSQVKNITGSDLLVKASDDTQVFKIDDNLDELYVGEDGTGYRMPKLAGSVGDILTMSNTGVATFEEPQQTGANTVIGTLLDPRLTYTPSVIQDIGLSYTGSRTIVSGTWDIGDVLTIKIAGEYTKSVGNTGTAEFRLDAFQGITYHLQETSDDVGPAATGGLVGPFEIYISLTRKTATEFLWVGEGYFRQNTGVAVPFTFGSGVATGYDDTQDMGVHVLYTDNPTVGSCYYVARSAIWTQATPANVITSITTSDHTALNNLVLGDAGHTQFPMLSGRAGGQVLTGGTLASDSLTLSSTSDGTKGQIVVQDELKMSSKKIVDVLDCVDPQDAATKAYVDSVSGGDVSGPASAVDGNLCSFDTTSGKLIKDSGLIVDGSSNLTVPGDISGENLYLTDGVKAPSILANYKEPLFTDPSLIAPDITKTGRNFVKATNASFTNAWDADVITCAVTTTNYKLLFRLNSTGNNFRCGLSKVGGVSDTISAPYVLMGSTTGGAGLSVQSSTSGTENPDYTMTGQTVADGDYIELRLTNNCQDFRIYYHGQAIVSNPTLKYELTGMSTATTMNWYIGDTSTTSSAFDLTTILAEGVHVADNVYIDGGVSVSGDLTMSDSVIYGSSTKSQDLKLSSTSNTDKGKVVSQDDFKVSSGQKAEMPGALINYTEPMFEDASLIAPDITKSGRNFVKATNTSYSNAWDADVLTCAVTTTNYKLIFRLDATRSVFRCGLAKVGGVSDTISAPYVLVGSTLSGVGSSAQSGTGGTENPAYTMSGQTVADGDYIELRLTNNCQDFRIYYHGQAIVPNPTLKYELTGMSTATTMNWYIGDTSTNTSEFDMTTISAEGVHVADNVYVDGSVIVKNNPILPVPDDSASKTSILGGAFTIPDPHLTTDGAGVNSWTRSTWEYKDPNTSTSVYCPGMPYIFSAFFPTNPFPVCWGGYTMLQSKTVSEVEAPIGTYVSLFNDTNSKGTRFNIGGTIFAGSSARFMLRGTVTSSGGNATLGFRVAFVQAFPGTGVSVIASGSTIIGATTGSWQLDFDQINRDSSSATCEQAGGGIVLVNDTGSLQTIDLPIPSGTTTDNLNFNTTTEVEISWISGAGSITCNSAMIQVIYTGD